MGFLDKIMGIDDELSRQDAAQELAEDMVQNMGRSTARLQLREMSRDPKTVGMQYMVDALEHIARVWDWDKDKQELAADLAEYAETLR